MIYDELADRLAKACECDIDDILGPAEETDIDSLGVLGVPDSVVEFYREYAPLDTIDIGDNRLWTIPHMMEENQSYSPGADVHELGYVVIAGNRKGDVFCLDLGASGDEDPPAVIKHLHGLQTASHDRTEIEKQAVPIADTFDDFLDLFAKQEVPETQ
jgi:hypothetical protein